MHLERNLTDLDGVVQQLGGKLDALEGELRALRQAIEGLGGIARDGDPGQDRPPHY